MRPGPFIANSVYSLAFSGHLADMRRDYKDLNAPLLLLSGDSDRTVSAQIHSERLHGENPNTGLVIWPGAGHMVQHTRADEIVAIVARLADGQIWAGCATRTRGDANQQPRSHIRVRAPGPAGPRALGPLGPLGVGKPFFLHRALHTVVCSGYGCRRAL